MKVLLVTSWGTACGVAEHSAMLKEAVERADTGIAITPCFELDPRMLMRDTYQTHDVVHLNYHAALHSRWTADEIRDVDVPVLVTYHDSGVPNSDQCKAVIDAADAAVVHEPFDDLPPEKTRYWRMGIPGWQRGINPEIRDHDARPVVGTIGFPFPWKCHSKLIEVAASVGWGTLLIAPQASDAQVEAWLAIDPDLQVRTDFVSRTEAVQLLAGCDATSFCYVTHNTGQSGAICLGIAARKPVVALSTCRQFRALYQDPVGSAAIHWCDTFEDVAAALCTMPIQRCDPAMVALAEQDSWEGLGQKYAELYRELVA